MLLALPSCRGQMDIIMTLFPDTSQTTKITAVEIQAGRFQFRTIGYMVNICIFHQVILSLDTRNMCGLKETGLCFTTTVVL